MENMNTEKQRNNMNVPTKSYVMASWMALFIGVGTYLIGLYNAGMQLNEKGYYLTLLLFGLYSAISIQKVIRDKDDGIPTTSIYYGICWMALLSALLLMAIGLYNAGSITLSEKGFYGMSYILSLFASVTVQKNVRDLENAKSILNKKSTAQLDLVIKEEVVKEKENYVSETK